MALIGDEDSIKEYAIGIDVFERSSDFDPRSDPIVRVQAGRLRLKLLEYYEGPGASDPVRIEIPKRTYAPVFHFTGQDQKPAAAPLEQQGESDLEPPRTRLFPFLSGAQLAWFAGGALLAILTVYLIFGREKKFSSYPQPLQFSVDSDREFVHHRVSPDGKYVAWMTRRPPALKIRELATGVTRSHALSSRARALAWAPDSKTIAYFENRRLWKTAADGKQPEMFDAIVPYVSRLEWAPSSEMLLESADGIVKFRPGSNRVEEAVRSEDSRVVFKNPHFLSDGNRFILAGRTRGERATRVYIASLDNSVPRLLGTVDELSGIASHANVAVILQYRDRSILARELDLNGGSISSEPTVLFQPNSSEHARLAAAHVEASSSGVISWWAPVEDSHSLSWIDESRMPGAALEGTVAFAPDFALSRDGSRLVATTFASPSSERTAVQDRFPTQPGGLAVLDLASGVRRNLTESNLTESNPLLSPDGYRLALRRYNGRSTNIVVRPIEGSGAEEIKVSSPYGLYPQDWSSDGRWVAYVESVPNVGLKLRAADVRSGGTSGHNLDLFTARGGGLWASFSHDSKWLVICHSDSGQFEVYVQPFRPETVGQETQLQLSTEGGVDPRFSNDGRRVFFISPDTGDMYAATFNPNSPQKVGPPRRLFGTSIRWDERCRNTYAITKDNRFLIYNSTQSGESRPLELLVNWPRLLRPNPVHTAR